MGYCSCPSDGTVCCCCCWNEATIAACCCLGSSLKWNCMKNWQRSKKLVHQLKLFAKTGVIVHWWQAGASTYTHAWLLHLDNSHLLYIYIVRMYIYWACTKRIWGASQHYARMHEMVRVVLLQTGDARMSWSILHSIITPVRPRVRFPTPLAMYFSCNVWTGHK